MNRRRPTSASRKKPVRKKPIQRRPADEKQSRRRPGHKNAPANGASKKRTARKAAVAGEHRKKAASKKASPLAAQNRRRPVPKKSTPPHSTPTWRERFTSVRGNVGGWAFRHHAGLRRGAHVVVALAGLAVLFWVGQRTASYARSADAFAIHQIEIDGNAQLDDIDVRRAAHLQIGSNIFEVSALDVRNHLLQHPWIADAKVVRRLPSRVRIEVVERTPVALVALDQLYLVSEEGAVFKRLGVDDPADFPILTGIASERFYDDLDYRTQVLLDSMALLQDYEGAGLAESEPVSEIHFDGANGIELFVGDDGMNVRLGNGHHRQKLRRLRQVLARLGREKTRPSYVYLDNVRSPERVTVRLP